MAKRTNTMRRLEEAYAVHMGFRTVERNLESLPIVQPPPPVPTAEGVREDEREDTDEHDRLVMIDGQPHIRPYAKVRPKTRIRYGRFGLQSRQVDAIDYYQEQLREADEEIKRLREKDYAATPIAFVTMDSVAACQMAIQAVLDPSPLQLIANPSPAPGEVMWHNTYLPRRSRMLRSWSVTLGILLLSVFWSIILVPVAGLLNTDTIGKVFPQLAEFLDAHKNIKSLVAAQLPTIVTSLLMIFVPYMYYWLSYYQGWISVGDMELSAISKNFLFVFINFFVIFTALGTFSQFYQFFERFGDALRDFRRVAITRQFHHPPGFRPATLQTARVWHRFPVSVLPHGSQDATRLCRVGSAANIQLWILLANIAPRLHYLHGVQRLALILEDPARRNVLFFNRTFCVQISASVRNGPPTAFDWTRLGHDLRPYLCRLNLLPSHHSRPADPQRSYSAQSAPCAANHRYDLDVYCV
jgi:hypothetical protein